MGHQVRHTLVAQTKRFNYKFVSPLPASIVLVDDITVDQDTMKTLAECFRNELGKNNALAGLLLFEKLVIKKLILRKNNKESKDETSPLVCQIKRDSRGGNIEVTVLSGVHFYDNIQELEHLVQQQKARKQKGSCQLLRGAEKPAK